MKVASAADWRGSIPFETAVLVADLVPGEPTRCATCGPDSAPRERTELWAFKHRHPNHHDGYVRFYCRDHVPVVRRAPAPEQKPRAPRTERAPRRPAQSDTVRAMCPNCFVEVSAAGECGMCGTRIA